MYFKRLELIGFKSFAEKTVLNFEPGVTAIVGPNGCGKSNLAESIRWVLGEQSTKSMRASSMQDVIFNGTDTKEPINFAEVSLTLSNEKRILPIDYDEVTITRRIFRSAENEYLLNKTPVRLKDISELLMGTGIGTESYSIIEQGKMDLILSSRPEDRRYVFEEASGITKYKAKKKEALRKLEETEQNLVRINDIIQEVKRQISSIERQAKKAERYKAELEKLKDLELRLSSYEYRNLKGEEKTACVARDDLAARQNECLDLLNQMGSSISALRTALDAVNWKISELKNKNVELASVVDKNRHKIAIDRERIAETKAFSDGLSKEVAALESKMAEQVGLVESLTASASRLQDERNLKAKSLEKKEARSLELSGGIERDEKSLSAAKLETMDLLTNETRVKNELIKILAELSGRFSRQRRLTSEKETVAGELAAEETKLKEAEAAYGAIDGHVRALREGLLGSRREYEALLGAIKALDEELNRLRNDQTAARSKIEFLEDIIKRHEGFSAGVKAILSSSGAMNSPLGGIVGVLADMIEVDRGYEEAVNAVLGDDAETIVVNTLKDALASIAFLRDNRLGRAKFISLEELRRSEKGNGSSGKKGLAPLSDYIRVDGKLRDLVRVFFADTYVVDSIEDVALKGHQEGFRFVTRSGILVDDRGGLSGGSAADKDESLLVGRKERLKNFMAAAEESARKITGLERDRASKASSVQGLEGKVKELEETLHQEEIDLANAASKRDAVKSGLAKFREEVSLLDLELDEIGQTITDIRSKEEAYKAELADSAARNNELAGLISHLTDGIARDKDEREKIALEMAALRTELTSLEREFPNAENGLNKEKALLAEFEASIESKKDLLKESARKVEDLSGEIVSLEAENVTFEKDLSLFNEENAGLEKERSDSSDKLGIAELQVKESEKVLEELRGELKTTEMKIMDLGYKKTSLKERIISAYKVDLDSAHIEVDDDADWETIRANIQEWKTKLDEMGPVNLVAIDEHKELEERYAFLTHQQLDLVNAKESLHKAILKINKTTKELFLEVFQKIQIEFKNFFRMLFGGGQAELVLIDEQDVLESGIEIVARPPGKKLQNIMLLSGGEKALTAIALLFAIFKVKPSPFCLLDEIDAPLDESNIMRFSNVLKDFLKMSQFILITHNKKTIELADVMYGITMQERGISKIVSVKFLAGDKEADKEKDGKKEEVLA